MLTIDWMTHRYRLPDFNEKDLRQALQLWVRSRGSSILAIPKFNLKKMYWITSCTIADSKIGIATSIFISLYISYSASVLYVFSVENKKLPSACLDIFDSFFTAYVRSHGGKPFDETPLAFTISAIVNPLTHFESLQVDFHLLVHLDPNVQRVEAAREEIHITEGVSVTVKRSRTISHAVEVINTVTGGLEFEAGLKVAHLDILKATAMGEIQKQTGTRFEESETVEHEITLSGEKRQNYILSWTDFMRTGFVEVDARGTKKSVPFNWRERTELNVVPA
jgi:hypothetical protein